MKNCIPKISIIVPVYNVEKYLRQCIDSILGQTFTDFELLLINDGSTDSSGKICDEYAAKDPRVRVFHKKNGGVSSSRNLGIKEAKGDFISFVDSDDYIGGNFLEELYKKAIDTGSDVCVCGYVEKRQYSEKIIQIPWLKVPNIGLNILENIIVQQTIPPVTSLIKKDIIDKYEMNFNESCNYGEDQEFIYKTIFHCNQICSIDKCFYYYRIGHNSAISSKTLKHFDFPLAMIRLRDYLKSNNCSPEIIKNIDLIKIPLSIDYAITNVLYSPIQFNDILDLIFERNLATYMNINILWRIHPLVFLYCKWIKIEIKLKLRALRI